ncbi:MAG: 3-hydroxyacyl-CoA dehydrogenase NAD-binding domain-containing protein [Pseudomonadota bacterium]
MIAGFSHVGVIGAGQMGSGIAQVMATSGLSVTLMDTQGPQLEKARKSISASAERLKSKNLLTAEQVQRATNIFFEESIEGLKSCDLVIEAIVENEGVKKDLFSRLDLILPSHSVIASNTSSISITRLGSATKRPDRVIGMHFMNPVPLMKLVEIIPGMATSDLVLQNIKLLAAALGKEVSISRDYPGFIVNRILMPMINEAFFALMEGVASAEDIDRGMKLGTNQPMGPLELADFIGLDTCLYILNVMYKGLGDSKYRPSPLLIQYVDAGWMGRKSGRGVFHY